MMILLIIYVIIGISNAVIIDIGSKRDPYTPDDEKFTLSEFVATIFIWPFFWIWIISDEIKNKNKEE